MQMDNRDFIDIDELKDKLIEKGIITQEQINEDYIISVGNTEIDLKDYAKKIKAIFEEVGKFAYVVPKDGTYRIELWGAQGGGNTNSGFGAYTAGSINLKKGEKLYFYVGNKPTRAEDSFNGGGKANNSYYPSDDGGGATDVRIQEGQWADPESLRSRIMVAGAGGGIVERFVNGSSAGGLIGYDGTRGGDVRPDNSFPTGGSQLRGGNRSY